MVWLLQNTLSDKLNCDILFETHQTFRVKGWNNIDIEGYFSDCWEMSLANKRVVVLSL